MFNKIRRAITGYKVKNVSINGVEIRTKYKGKKPSSDPFNALKELKMKLIQTPTATFINMDLSKCWENRFNYLKGIEPSSIAKYQIDNRKYIISRYVTRQNRSPLSLYTFSTNDKVFGLFSRVYDHGNFFNEIENEIITNYNYKKPDLETNLHFITNDKYSVIVDIFGHSQSFFWNDQDELNKCLEVLV